MALDKAMAELSKEHISGLGVTYIPTAGHWSLMEEYEQVNQAMDRGMPLQKSSILLGMLLLWVRCYF